MQGWEARRGRGPGVTLLSAGLGARGDLELNSRQSVKGTWEKMLCADGHVTLTMVRLCRMKVWRPSQRNFMQSSKTTTIRASSSKVAWTCQQRGWTCGITSPILPTGGHAQVPLPLRLETVGGTTDQAYWSPGAQVWPLVVSDTIRWRPPWQS